MRILLQKKAARKQPLKPAQKMILIFFDLIKECVSVGI